MINSKLIKNEYTFSTIGAKHNFILFDLNTIKEFENNLTKKGEKLLRKNKMYKKDRPMYKRKIKEYNKLLKKLKNGYYTYTKNKGEKCNNENQYHIFYGMLNMFNKFTENKNFKKAKSYLEVLQNCQKNEEKLFV
ncbi:MAG: hypothetical protein ACQEQE_11210 [Bacillota bacterium]